MQKGEKMNDNRPHLKIINGTPTDAFINDFKLFISTDDKLLKTIFTNLKLKPNIEIGDELKRLSKHISFNLKDLDIIIKVGNSIFVQLEQKKITVEDLCDDLNKLNFDKNIFEKLKVFYDDFGKNYAIELSKYELIRSNLYSLSPRIRKILYELNVRAIESKEEKQEIIDNIPVAKIEFESNLEDKGFRNVIGLDRKRFSFAATIEDLEEIIDELNKIKLKLKALSK